MAAAGQRFPRADRLLRRRDFRRVGQSSQRAVGRDFVLLLAKSQRQDAQEGARIGITVSRRVGGAVVRNRIKRRIREWFRRSAGSIALRQDLLVIARHSAAQCSGREIGDGLERLLERATRAAVT